MSDLDFSEFRDLMVEDLRARQRERTAGHTMAALHDNLRGMGVRVANLEGRVDRVETRTLSSAPPPMRGRAHSMGAIAEVHPDDSPTLVNFKTGELANVIQQARFMSTLWKAVTAIAITVAAIVSIYSAVKR